MKFFTSDWHFCHDKEFIWKARGFSSVDEMNEELVRRHNSIVNADDDVYVLGDLMLSGQDHEKGLRYVRRMNGRLHIICGNHDSEERKKLYKTLPNVVEVTDAKYLKMRGFCFFLCHYPSDTSNLDFDKIPFQRILFNLHGHTHQTADFLFKSNMLHVGVDSHNCYPVSEEEVIRELLSTDLAIRLDAFSEEYDTYSYYDIVDDRGAEVDRLQDCLLSGNVTDIKAYLQGVVDDDAYCKDEAAVLLKELALLEAVA